jgi:hypothetical protein
MACLLAATDLCHSETNFDPTGENDRRPTVPHPPLSILSIRFYGYAISDGSLIDKNDVHDFNVE